MKRKSPRKKPAQQELAKQDHKQRRMQLLLVVCVVVLVGGLGVRWLNQRHRQSQIQMLHDQLLSAQRRQDWPQVESLAQQWTGLEPSAYAPRRYGANAARELQNPGLAVGYLSGIPKGSPLEDYLELGYLQMEALNDPLAAFETCRLTLDFYPDDSETHQRLLFFYTMTCQRDALAAEARRAIEVGSASSATYVYLLGSRWLTFKNGYETNLKWLQSSPQSSELFEVAAVMHLPSAPLLEEMARQASGPEMEPRPLEFVNDHVDRLLEKYPQNIELLAAKIRQLCRAGEVEQVARRLANVPAETRNDNRFWRYKGWLHSALEQWPEALQAYRHALELEPFDWSTQLKLATALRTTADLAASSDMQARADLGKQIMLAIQSSPSIHELQPISLYDDIQHYFQMCGQAALAEKLAQLIAE